MCNKIKLEANFLSKKKCFCLLNTSKVSRLLLCAFRLHDIKIFSAIMRRIENFPSIFSSHLSSSMLCAFHVYVKKQ